MEQKEIKIATGEIAAEMRALAIGESVAFPLDKYKYNSVRASPSTTLVRDRLDGKRWSTRLDLENGCVVAKRTA